MVTLTAGQPVSIARNGLRLTVTVDRVVVDPGGVINVALKLANERDTPLVYRDAACDMHLTATAELAVPGKASGKAWSGIEGSFKATALSSALGPGGVAWNQAYVRPFGPVCLGGVAERSLAPGAAVSGSGSWTADLAPGMPADPGAVPVAFSVEYDIQRIPDASGSLTGPSGVSQPQFSALWATSAVTVADAGQPGTSAALAIDAALANPRFDAWLHERPEADWSNINLYVDGDGWHVEAFREEGPSTRSWAMATVASSAEVADVNVCAAPCDH
jgi:hypothetical protein